MILDEKEKRGKEVGGRKRIYLDSEGEEEDESDQETSDEEEIAKHNKSRGTPPAHSIHSFTAAACSHACC